MDLISFRCPACNQTLKAPPERAGRKARCGNCGTDVTVPAATQVSAAAPKPAARLDEDDDEGGAYGFLEPAEKPKFEPETKKKKKEEKPDEDKKKPKPKRTAKRKAPTFPEKWQKVRAGLVVVFAATCTWGLVVLLQEVVLLVGIINGPEYASVQQKVFAEVKAPVEPGEPMPVHRPSLLIGMLTGTDSYELGKTLYTVAAVLALVQSLIAITGYGLLTAVPPRFGTRGQAIALLVVGSVNLIFVLVFKLLPVTGAMNYTLVPYLVPEVAMMDANTDRLVPVHLFWCAAPFWEMFLTFLVMFSFFAEPIMVLVFLRACGLSLRDEEYLQPTAISLLRLAFGQAFIMMAYYMFSMCGTSDVLLWVLRVTYGIWLGFFTGFLIWYCLVLLRSRAVIQKFLDGD